MVNYWSCSQSKNFYITIFLDTVTSTILSMTLCAEFTVSSNHRTTPTASVCGCASSRLMSAVWTFFAIVLATDRPVGNHQIGFFLLHFFDVFLQCILPISLRVSLCDLANARLMALISTLKRMASCSTNGLKLRSPMTGRNFWSIFPGFKHSRTIENGQRRQLEKKFLS